MTASVAPPTVLAPTLFPSLPEFVALTLGLTAIEAMPLDLALQLPFLLLDAALAFIEIVSVSTARGAEQEKPAKSCGE